jgi:hypothetical protein
MFEKSKKPEADTFWREYEEKIGDTILAHALGRYISGWDPFDGKEWNNIWGLVILAGSSLRFHHFPQMSWIDAFTRFTEKEPPKEKTFFIPNEKIISAKLLKERKWWKRILSSSPPQLVIHYLDDEGTEKILLFEIEFKADELLGNLPGGAE